MAARISSAVNRRTRRQSVRGSFFDMLPEVSSLMRLGSPCRNQVPLVVVPIGVDDGEFKSIDQADCINSHLATVIETIVDAFYRRTVENSRSVTKGNSVPPNIGFLFPSVPREPHWDIYTMYLRIELPSIAKTQSPDITTLLAGSMSH